ncbi:hypothetical protein HAX54_007904, partial [Datura stramonium]|nr:hypothetical protein [Datura stramonium]
MEELSLKPQFWGMNVGNRVQKIRICHARSATSRSTIWCMEWSGALSFHRLEVRDAADLHCVESCDTLTGWNISIPTNDED